MCSARFSDFEPSAAKSWEGWQNLQDKQNELCNDFLSVRYVNMQISRVILKYCSCMSISEYCRSACVDTDIAKGPDADVIIYDMLNKALARGSSTAVSNHHKQSLLRGYS